VPITRPKHAIIITFAGMAGNTFGTIFKITTFGESHGVAVGGIIDGCPSGIKLNLDQIQTELNRRRPGQSALVSPRNESDQIIFLSGLSNGLTTGAPIAFMVENKNQQSSDYDALKDVYRPSHADYTYTMKYGIRDHRGSGRASARETLSRVVGGAVAAQINQKEGIEIIAWVKAIGPLMMADDEQNYQREDVEKSLVRCPDADTAKKMESFIESLKQEGDSTGGIIECMIKNVPVGLGEPVFDRLEADLAKAMLSLPATKGFEIGSGFSMAAKKGSEVNDAFVMKDGKISGLSNHSGGVQGGISNGENIVFRVAFKPASTIKKEQQTINQKGETIRISPEGRHDPCVVPRAVPIVEAMAHLVITDHLFRNLIYQQTKNIHEKTI
jgi:chorismate synthase